MDQTKLEDKVICRHQQECCDDANLDCFVCVLDSKLSQIHVWTKEKHAENYTTITDELV